MKFRITIVALLLCSAAIAQVGIGTVTPDPSAVLDVSSEAQGLLAPRMTTAQRNAITTPANSLLVYDTTLDAYYYYNTATTSWLPMSSGAAERDNYKLIKSAADLAPELSAGGGSTYLLDENTYYEINGTIVLAAPIDLNDAYLSGLDANEDILAYGGTIFSGSKGGSIRNVTLSGGGTGTAFNITGGNSLLVQNTIVANFSNVGSIAGLNIFFGNIIQFTGNTNGISYSNIDDLLLSNQGWFGDNTGTYETFSGTFDLIQKVSGFSNVPSGETGMNITGIASITGDAVLNQVVFYGGGTYVNGNSPYTGYNFTNDWTVNCPGIPRESDDVATGDINFTANVGSGSPTLFTGTGSSSRKKIAGGTASNSLFRFEAVGNNRIVYKGTKSRFFNVNASLSFQSQSQTATTTYIFYIAKGNGAGSASVITETKIYGRANNNNDILSIPIVGTIEMGEDDYIEIWAERFSGDGDMLTVSLNVAIQ